MSISTNTTGRGSKVYPGVLQSIASSTMTSDYQVLGTFAYPARVFKITNNSTEDVTLSWDGTNAHEYIPAGSFLLIDCSSNRQVNDIFSIPLGTTLYVMGTAGTGNVYLSYYYASSM